MMISEVKGRAGRGRSCSSFFMAIVENNWRISASIHITNRLYKNRLCSQPYRCLITFFISQTYRTQHTHRRSHVKFNQFTSTIYPSHNIIPRAHSIKTAADEQCWTIAIIYLELNRSYSTEAIQLNCTSYFTPPKR